MNRKNKLIRAIIYARGVPDAIERQLQTCREFATKNGLTVTAEVVETKAETRGRRSPFAKLIEEVDAHDPDVVIVTDLDRLSRCFGDIVDMLQKLAERHVRITSIANSTKCANWQESCLGVAMKLMRSTYAPLFSHRVASNLNE